MKLSTGKVAFPIEFDNGDKEIIYFNPNDREFIKRVMDFENSIEERTKKINIDKYKDRIEDGIDINLNIDDFSQIEKMSAEEIASLRRKVGAIVDIDAEYQQALKDELNDIFKSDISSQIFKYCEPMDMVFTGEIDENGNEISEMFILQFLRAFAEQVKKHQAKVSPAMQKHLDKYKR
jgi:hypothetical protein